jgi:arylsulfatase
VREGDWKLVRWGKESPWDLYNVSDDPTETTNLAVDYPERVEEMERLFLEWKKDITNSVSN